MHKQNYIPNTFGIFYSTKGIKNLVSWEQIDSNKSYEEKKYLVIIFFFFKKMISQGDYL